MNRYKLSNNKWGISLKVDGWHTPFEIIVDSEKKLIVAIVLDHQEHKLLEALNA